MADSIAACGWNGADTNFLVISGCVRLGAAPAVDGWHCELTPVDFASEVIVAKLPTTSIAALTSATAATT